MNAKALGDLIRIMAVEGGIYASEDGRLWATRWSVYGLEWFVFIMIGKRRNGLAGAMYALDQSQPGGLGMRQFTPCEIVDTAFAHIARPGRRCDEEYLGAAYVEGDKSLQQQQVFAQAWMGQCEEIVRCASEETVRAELLCMTGTDAMPKYITDALVKGLTDGFTKQ